MRFLFLPSLYVYLQSPSGWSIFQKKIHLISPPPSHVLENMQYSDDEELILGPEDPGSGAVLILHRPPRRRRERRSAAVPEDDDTRLVSYTVNISCPVVRAPAGGLSSPQQVLAQDNFTLRYSCQLAAIPEDVDEDDQFVSKTSLWKFCRTELMGLMSFAKISTKNFLASVCPQTSST